MTIGERIKAARKAKGLTQKELGEACGIAESTIRRYELGKLNPKYETLQKIAKPLGISALKLYGVEPLSEDFLLFLEETDIRYHVKDPKVKERLLGKLERYRKEGISPKLQEDMNSPYLAVIDLVSRVGFSGFAPEECPLPSGYDPDGYEVARDERTGKYYICDMDDFFAMTHEIGDYVTVKLQEYFSNSVPYVPDIIPERKPFVYWYWENREKYLRTLEEYRTNKKNGPDAPEKAPNTPKGDKPQEEAETPQNEPQGLKDGPKQEPEEQ